jgi:hypothetical protein
MDKGIVNKEGAMETFGIGVGLRLEKGEKVNCEVLQRFWSVVKSRVNKVPYIPSRN